MATEEAVWVFVGLVIGIGVGIPLGWIVAQAISQGSSTIHLEKTERGYVITER